MPWIQNVSFDGIQKGHHFDPGVNSLLIQIVDPDMDFPKPAFPFKVVHQFKFLDIEEEHEQAITEEQAMEIARILLDALDNRMNVTVHCVAGVCRSGAVTEVGTMIGFTDTETFRIPNLMVKRKLINELSKG